MRFKPIENPRKTIEKTRKTIENPRKTIENPRKTIRKTKVFCYFCCFNPLGKQVGCSVKDLQNSWDLEPQGGGW